MTTAHASAEIVDGTTPDSRSLGWLGWVLPPATMIVLLALPLLLLLTPFWVHAAIDLAGGSAPGGVAAVAHSVSDETVRQLVVGGDFVVVLPGGSAMYTADEAGHMRDVRIVLYVFLGLAIVSGATVLAALRLAPRVAARWAAVARGAAILIALLVALGVTGALAFGFAFEVFHKLLFPGGNWAFPVDSNLIRLYPIGFWQLSAGVLGLLAIVGAAVVWALARRRADALERPR